jgi:hypothetical protein
MAIEDRINQVALSTAQYRATAQTLDDGEYSSLQSDVAGNLKVTVVSTTDPVNDGIRTYPDASDTNISASSLIKTGSGRVQGIVINSHTAGTIKLWDNTAASGTVIVNTITFAVGERFIPLFGASFGTGLYASIGGTADVSLMYN